MPMIDLGKMPTKDSMPTEVAPAKKKPEKYYPSSYMDDIGDISIDDLTIDKDIKIEAVIRIKSATKNKKKDEKGTKETVDLNYEMRSIDFAPDSKKEKLDLQDAIEEGLAKKA